METLIRPVLSQHFYRLSQRFRAADLQTVDLLQLIGVLFRKDDSGEAHPGGFSGDFFRMGDGTQVSGETDFSQAQCFSGNGDSAERRVDRSGHCEIGRGTFRPDPADDIQIDVLCRK